MSKADKKTAATFDPHQEKITSRDWTFLIYLVIGLCLIPFLIILGVIYAISASNPNFDTLPKDRIDLNRPAVERGE